MAPAEEGNQRNRLKRSAGVRRGEVAKLSDALDLQSCTLFRTAVVGANELRRIAVVGTGFMADSGAISN